MENLPKYPRQSNNCVFFNEVERTREFLSARTHDADARPSYFLRPKLAEMQQQSDYDQVKNLAEELVRETSQQTHLHLFNEFVPYFGSDEIAERVFANHLVDTMLKPLGLDLSVSSRWIELSTAAESIDDPYLKQAQAIHEFMPVVIYLETIKPGAVKYFVDNFGLRCFGSVVHTDYFMSWYDTLTQTEAQEGESEQQKWIRLISESLGKVGISDQSIEQLFETWTHCSRDSNSFISVTENFKALFEVYVKAQDPTIVPTLIGEFGIHNFCRYTPEVLIDQFNRRNDPGDFGLLIYPKSDWNEAFEQDSRVISELASESARLGINLRIIEAGSVSELVTRTGKLVRRSGAKIKYLVLGGHGTLNDIQLGGSPHWGAQPRNREVVRIEDVLRPETSLFRRWFVESPQVALVACSTGGDTGFAEKLSMQLQAKIIAPDKPTGVKKITLNLNEKGNLD